MGFKFSFLCDLLSNLENNRVVKASTAVRNDNPDIRVVSRWFAQHEKRLRHKDTDQLAVLSCMFPEKLPERVYWLQHTSLARVIGRCLLLGLSRREELERWRVSGGVDLGECVENVMRQAENHIPIDQEVCVEEIDAVLVRLASRCKFSGPRIRRQHTAVDVEECLGPLYRRMSSRDAKWLTRMILKNYSPVILPTSFVLRKFHFLLPPLLLFQDSFDSALKTLASQRIIHFPPHPEPGLAQDLGAIALQCLNPQTGVKIGRPDYYKARSIKHCCRMIDRRRMSIERKYDGEYCQIHVDLSKHPNIQIFSKSGKDSTVDRAGIHQTLRQSLRIGSPKCLFSKRCILEGELLVWSDKQGRIMDFHKLRKFISRSGIFIGTENDSLPQPYEHLMIMFFDILVLDDDVCLKKAHWQRRLLLKDVVQTIEGRADIAEQHVLDFSRIDSQYILERLFAKAISNRWEGCVLKGCDDPYFSIFSNNSNGTFGRWIKLKKDYIPGLGDTVDLALVGAKYDPRDAIALKRIPKLRWTHFFIGCLVNKDAVSKLGVTPRFRIIDLINRHCMNPRNMLILNQFGEFTSCDTESGHGFDIEYGKQSLPSMDVIFKTPFVVETLGSGFEKLSGARYFALRFPRISKIHWDRTFEDAATFQELQDLADKARAVTAEDDSTEQELWSKRLKMSNAQYTGPSSQSVSFTTTTTSGLEDENLEEYASRAAKSRVSTILPREKDDLELACIDPSSIDKGKTNIAANTIPIHVDSTAASSLSSSESGLRSNLLIKNANQATNQKAPVQKDHTTTAKSTLARAGSNEKAENVESADGRATSHTAFSFPPSSELAAERTEHFSAASTTEKQQTHLKSPLLAIPKYRSQTPPFREHHLTGSSQPISALYEFLQALISQHHDTSLKNSPPDATTQDQSVGLVFLNSTSSLGPELLAIINQLSKHIKEPCDRDFPPNGKIFFLDSNVLSLGTGPADLRFCLRATWENIRDVYFYACISWTTTTFTTITENPSRYALKDEIPCTSSPEIGNDMTPDNPTPTPTPTPISRKTVVPSITVSFGKEELHYMGRQFCLS